MPLPLNALLPQTPLPNNLAPQAQAPTPDPYDFSTRFNTQLTPQDEQDFMAWATAKKKLNDVYDYDLRGAFKELQSGAMSEADNGHLGDKYKKPNHPTFSDLSIYHHPELMPGGHWSKSETGKDIFVPSALNLQNMPQAQLFDYFNKYEKNGILSIPYQFQTPGQP